MGDLNSHICAFHTLASEFANFMQIHANGIIASKWTYHLSYIYLAIGSCKDPVYMAAVCVSNQDYCTIK